MRHTTRRRSEPDPLAPVSAPTWLVVREYRAPLEVTLLPPMADLRSILVAAHEMRKASGWAVEEIGRRSSSFFCSKDGTRVMIGIERRDPANPTLGHRSLRSR